MRQIRLSWSLRLYLKFLESSLVFCLTFNMMRIYDLMLFFYIKRLEVMSCPNSFHSVISSVFSLIISVNAFRVMIPDMLIYHLSSSRSSHEMIIVLNEINRCFFRASVEGISCCLLSVIVVISVLYDLLP